MHACMYVLSPPFNSIMNFSSIPPNLNSPPPSKAVALNPNAPEFLPFALRSPPSATTHTTSDDAPTQFPFSGSQNKPLSLFESSDSSVSDRQSWSRHLPHDITPDFNVIHESSSQQGHLSFNMGGEGLSLHQPTGSYLLNHHQQVSSPRHNNHFNANIKYSVPSSPNFLNLPLKPWDSQIPNSRQLYSNGREAGTPYDENSRHEHDFLNDMLLPDPTVVEDETIPLEFLATQFPGLAAESLAEVYFANQCDLNSTLEMLAQLELQFDEAIYPNFNSKTLSAPNLSPTDFPTLPVPDGQNGMQKYAGDDLSQSGNTYRSSAKDSMLNFRSSSSTPSRGARDYASALKTFASQDSNSIWKYDRDGSADANIGSSRSSHVLAGSHNGRQGRAMYSDKLQNHGSARAAPAWVDTGEAVANMYSELVEEARDHARLRNAYFEQARQAYLIGNKALAKELGVKGQLHNMQMKAAHEQAQDSIYRQRNPAGPEVQGNVRVRERMIDLHGLHLSEAIVVLKNELSVLRSTSRSLGQRLQVYICVGTSHHTRGTRTPARLPIAVQRYLLEEERLDYTEPQPGILRVVIH